MNFWLMKTEPETFSIEDLKKRPNQQEHWDGVRNYQARNIMRDEMKVGDKAFFYHSNAKPPGIVGIVEIISESYPDHTALDPKSSYYDAKSTPDNPRWFMVDVKFKCQFKRMISLQEMKDNPALSGMGLLKKGNRLSVMPVSYHDWQIICDLANV